MKLKYEFVINNVAGEIVAVSVGNNDGQFNGYIKLNETGAFIFKMLQKETTREDTKKLIANLERDYPALKNKIINALKKDNISNW